MHSYVDILRRKANGIVHILRGNYLFHEDIERYIIAIIGVGSRTQLLNDMRNRRRYWELKEGTEDRKRWKRQFINRT